LSLATPTVAAADVLHVDEGATRLRWLEDRTEVELGVANSSGAAVKAEVALEILDPDGAVRGSARRTAPIAPGATTLVLPMEPSLSTLKAREQSEILMYRLHYQVRPVASGAGVDGIVSLSEIAQDLFELSMTAAEHVSPGSPYPITVRSSRARDDAPIGGVSVEATLRLDDPAPPLVVSGVTDRNGLLSLEFDLPRDVPAQDAILSVVGSHAGRTETAITTISLVLGGRVLLTTDKGLYQPGQTIHTRLVALDASRHALAGAAGLIEIKSPEGQRVLSTKVTTSRFGVASADWSIPANVRLGDYSVEARLDGERWAGGMQWVRISRYELPEFTVEATPDRPYYLPGERPRVEIRGTYMFGKPLKGARARIVRENERRWDYKTQSWQTDEGEAYEGTTNAEGIYKAQLDLTKDQEQLHEHSSARSQDITFAAYLTDASTGRTECRRFVLRASRDPIHVYFIPGPTYDFPAQQPFDFYVSTYYADGTPAPSEVTIATAEQPDAPARKVRTNRYGVAKVTGFQAPKTEEDHPSVFIRAVDGRGRKGETEQHFWLSRETRLRVEMEHTIHRPGEPVRARIVGPPTVTHVLVELVREWQTLHSEVVRMVDGSARVAFGYQPSFRGPLALVAHPIDLIDSSESASHPVLYPADGGLRVSAVADRDSYRPGQEAVVRLSVTDAGGRPAESALGVVVVDKALEERARSEREPWLAGTSFREVLDRFEGAEELGGVTTRDLERLDLGKPMPEGLDLVAEILFRWYGSPRHTTAADQYRRDAAVLFERATALALAPVAIAARKEFDNGAYPETLAELKRRLKDDGIDIGSILDPWGLPYVPNLAPRGAKMVLSLRSHGPDKRGDTEDDFTALDVRWGYFEREATAIDRAFARYHERTGAFIRDEETLVGELQKDSIDLRALRDPWGHPYVFEFGIAGRHYTSTVKTAGPDGVIGGRRPDDAIVWERDDDYFDDARARLAVALDARYRREHTWPNNDSGVHEVAQDAHLDADALRDPWGTPYYFTFKHESQFSDRVEVYSFASYPEAPSRRTVLTPVTQKLGVIHVRSAGPDREPGTADDFDVADFWQVLAEQAATDTTAAPPAFGVLTGAGPTGSIRGQVTDEDGAALPGATVTITCTTPPLSKSVMTHEDGTYSFDGLPEGRYEVRGTLAGFRELRIVDVPVRGRAVTRVELRLSVAAVTEAITVAADTPAIQTSSSATAASITRSGPQRTASGPIATPRLRQDFPETLLWRPDVESDAEGRAVIRVPLADTITTWNLSVLASTLDGRLGVEKAEILAFQPFFVEHEPPPVLTQGDEVDLPVVLRNYLPEPLVVGVDLAPAAWFRSSGARRQDASVPAGESARTVFRFQATATTASGRQRITATSTLAGDAIEKSVSVHPNGEEVVRTLGAPLVGSTTIDFEMPAEAMASTLSAQLRLYPDLMAHVVESVESVLGRPYGCAEQTISSAYPSLLVLQHYRQRGLTTAVTSRAQHYLQSGYDSLLTYQQDDGGFSYWGRTGSDMALTAYALRFLKDAASMLAVDETVLAGARRFLIQRQAPDGGWTGNGGTGIVARDSAVTALVARSIAGTDTEAGRRALAYLAQHSEELDEPYAIALHALAAHEAGDTTSAARSVARLRRLVRYEGDGAYWHLETNSLFYAWGLPGRIEATAAAVEALARAGETSDQPLVERGVLFLLRSKDRYGAWFSTHATVSVVDALLAVEGRRHADLGDEAGTDGGRLEVLLDGHPLATDSPAGEAKDRLLFGLTPAVGPHRIEVRGVRTSDAFAEIVTSYYRPWGSQGGAAEAGPLRLHVHFDRTRAAIGEPVRCEVTTERIGFRCHGMLLAEIGLPPGADVDRDSLESARWSPATELYQYDILPDRVVAYLWPRGGESTFSFTFRPRMGLRAATAASRLYDYYNPEASTVVAPVRFTVRAREGAAGR
jgi:hypothetical protein